jgi:hypothetical protein
MTSGYSGHLPEMLEQLDEGGIFVDLLPVAEDPRFPSWVVRAPMARCDITERIAAPAIPAEMLGDFGLQGDFRGLAVLSEVHRIRGEAEPGPLDYVPPSYLAAYWKARGAAVTVKRGGALVPWEG